MINEEYNKWLILYFDMQSINLQFNCNDIASSLKAQRDKIKQFCIDCLTGVKHQADSFLFDTNACIFSTSETRELLFSHEEYLILDTDTTKVVDGKVYMTISNGTNGAEGCIINSMEDVLNVLKNLRKYKGVNWSQLLEVGIDNADDLYWWYVTFSIDTTAI